MQCEMKLKRIVNSLESLIIASPLNLPIAVPDARAGFADTRDAGSRTIHALAVVEALPIEIAQRKMRKIEIADIPNGGLRRIAIHRLAEKRELESKAMTAGGFEIAGVIPPLGLKIRMAEMIARKFEMVAGQCGTVLRGERRLRQKSYQKTGKPTPHESPRADSTARPRARDRARPERWPRKRW